MRIAGQVDGALALRQAVERRDEPDDLAVDLVDRGEQIQAQRGQHLVVTRAAEVQSPAGRADRGDQAILDRGVCVFVVQLDVPLAASMACADRREALDDVGTVFLGQESLRRKHLGVCDRAADVEFDEAFVEQVIFTRRVAQDLLIQR